jgi:hypothetical protein
MKFRKMMMYIQKTQGLQMKIKNKWFFSLYFFQGFVLFSQEKESKTQKQPLECVFYLCPDHEVNLDTVFFSYTSDLREGYSKSEALCETPEMGKNFLQCVQKTGLFKTLKKNPTICLKELGKIKGPLLDHSGQDFPVAISINNMHKKSLDLTLPPTLSMQLYIAGPNITLKSDTAIEKSLITGVHAKNLNLFVGMTFPYKKNMIPTTLVISSKCQAERALLIKTNVILKDGVLSISKNQSISPSMKGLHLKNYLQMHNATLLADEYVSDEKTENELSFYGKSSMEFKKKSSIKDLVSLYPEDTIFRSDPPYSPNNSIVTIKNVEFKPKRISYILHTKNKGHFKIDGKVDLTHTKLSIQLFNEVKLKTNETKKIILISSTQTIEGDPDVDVSMSPETEKSYDISFEKKDKKAYIIIKKNHDKIDEQQ